MTARDRSGRSLDVVLFGASGFVGRLTAAYLAAHAPADARIGLAGRSVERLQAVRADLGPVAAHWPLQVAAADDSAALADLARATRVVATTVGPYTRYGLPLVEACARAGTDYADLAGEVVFVRRSIDACHEIATSTGARIVHACGFDSVPSDLGVQLLSDRARADQAGGLTDTTLVVTSLRGGISGGTIDSMRAQLDSVRADPALGRLVRDPYALSPDRQSEPDPGPRRSRVRHDEELDGWLAPFVMAPYNTRIVRRSNALSGYAYGRTFRYSEALSAGSGLAAPVRAAGVAAGLGALAVGMSLRPTRLLLDRVLPAPGTGPDELTRRNGRFRMELRTTTTTGAGYLATVAAKGDPGYAATAVMLAESALALAFDQEPAVLRAGVLTPATALGAGLADRLRAAGFELSVSRSERGSLQSDRMRRPPTPGAPDRENSQ